MRLSFRCITTILVVIALGAGTLGCGNAKLAAKLGGYGIEGIKKASERRAEQAAEETARRADEKRLRVIEANLQTGKQHLSVQEYSTAEDAFSTALDSLASENSDEYQVASAEELDAYRAELYLLRGRARASYGNFWDARNDYQTSTRYGDLPEAYIGQAEVSRVLMDQASTRRALQQAYHSAERGYTRALLHFPDDPSLLHGYGDATVQYFLRSNEKWSRKTAFNNAARRLTKAIQIDPQLAAAHRSRALAYIELGSVYRAVRDAERAIELEPRNPESYYVRGFVESRRQKGRPGAAEYAYQALKLDPGNPKYLQAAERWKQPHIGGADILAGIIVTGAILSTPVGQKVMSCAIQHGVSQIVENPAGAALLAEAFGAVMEDRRYSLKNAVIGERMNDLASSLREDGQVEEAALIESSAFGLCLFN
jgi:tetratricopeptide (TPR) repeat protein